MYPTGYGSNTYGHFAATEVLVIAVTVPSSPSSYGTPFFSSQISQYVDNPVFRYATLSRSPCDFRPLDRTGQNGPISIGAHGQTVTVQGNVGGNGPMLPGQTWYISIRNIDDIDTARNTCSPLAHCDVIIGWNWPR
jgi:hypothetical protein